MRIAFFCDGTWNDPASMTNIYRMSCAASQILGEQHVGYDPGVGSDGLPLDHLFGGAFGTGLFQKIQDGYKQIANLYTPGDDIFLFGFSRGAYTARCIAGMIAVCGLPTNNIEQLSIEDVWDAYRCTDPAGRAAKLAALSAFGLFDACIRMVGVFDTVGSLGIPAVWGGIDDVKYGFLSVSLHPDVKNAFHALAIDEQRYQFPATLWTGPFEADQTVEQVWFTGVHCDVGGGYAPEPADQGTRLADVTLGWMLGKAMALGMRFDPAFVARYRDAQGVTALGGMVAMDVAHNSRTGLYAAFPPAYRSIASTAALANSVMVRCQHTSDYRPENLTLVSSGVPDTTYGTEAVVLTAQPLKY